MKKNNLKIEVGKTYITRNGTKAIIYNINAGGIFPIHGAILVSTGNYSMKSWRHDGKYTNTYNDMNLDIISEYVEPLDFVWDCLPAWCDKYITMDYKDNWSCWSNLPEIDYDDITDWNGPLCLFIPKEYKPKWKGDWKKSLFMNPKYKT